MPKVNSKDGTQIAYETSGQGRAVLLVDGAFCSRAFGPMPALAPLRAGNFTVITYDRRGRNESGDTQPYAVEREIEDIQALIEAADGTAYVYGISSGAALALRAAAALPAITRLAMYEAPFIPPRTPRYLETFIELEEAGRRGDMVEHFMVDGVGQPREQVAGMRGQPFWAGLEALAHTLIYDTLIMGDFTVSPEITRLAGSIRAPALVMSGGASPEAMQNAARELARSIPGAEIRTLPGQTHDVDPKVIAPVLIEFFQKEA